jgi:hypothetical protein
MKKVGLREREKGQELERRIRAAGIPIVTEAKEEAPELLIRQDFGAYESTVFDLAGAAGLILPLQITVNVPIFVLAGVAISLDRYPNLWFRPLDENPRDEWPHYAFYGRSELKFDRSETINRFVAAPREFRRGQVLRGLLLALSNDPLPEEIAFGETLRGALTIYDQFECKHVAKFALQADRSAVRNLKANSRGWLRKRGPGKAISPSEANVDSARDGHTGVAEMRANEDQPQSAGGGSASGNCGTSPTPILEQQR